MSKQQIITALFFAVVLLAGIGLVANMKSEPTPLVFEGMEGVVVESPPTPLPSFEMVDQDGKPFAKKNYEDKWSIVFFGFTNCPDICPTTLADMNRLSREKDLPPTQFVFHTVDPKRDTPEAMKEFVTYFNKDIVGVTGPKSEIDKFAEPLGVIYGFEGDTESKDYVVTHFAAVYIIDPQARVRAYVLPPHGVERMKKVYLEVREYYGK